MNKEIFFVIDNIEYYLHKIYLEYEQPELFSVYNRIGNQFLVMLIDDERWLMTPISMTRLQELVYGKINIRDAFVKSEMEQVSIVSNKDGGAKAVNISPDEINEEDLPLESARLNWDNIPMPTVSESLEELARERSRDVFDVRIISQETENHTINVKELSSFLSMINELVLQTARVYNKAQGKQRYLTMGCGLKYVASYAGSLGLRFEGEEYSNILGETRLTPVLQQIFDWLSGKEQLAISKMVKESSLDIIKVFRKLLKFASDNEAALDFSFATPNKALSRNVLWEESYSRNTLGYLDELMKEEEKEDEFIGTLVSISKKQYRFGFITDEGDNIDGVIDTPLKNRKFQVECKAKIKVKRSIKINNANETEEKIKLIDIQELEPEATGLK